MELVMNLKWTKLQTSNLQRLRLARSLMAPRIVERAKSLPRRNSEVGSALGEKAVSSWQFILK
jgi:hypothetical protein